MTKAEQRYRDFVRSLTCPVTGNPEGNDNHHAKGYAYLTGSGGSMKGHILSQIPLRHDLHNELHDIGWQTFENIHNIDQRDEMLRTIFKAYDMGIIKII